MLIEVLIVCFLVVVTVTIHAAGFSVLLRALMWSHALRGFGFLLTTGRVIGVTCGLLLIHLAEIVVWGLFYLWRGCMPDVRSAIYFSAGTYSTLGAGDLVLPTAWRILAPLEAMTAVLMCGLSTGLFFALVSRWISNWMKEKAALEPDEEIEHRRERNLTAKTSN